MKNKKIFKTVLIVVFSCLFAYADGNIESGDSTIVRSILDSIGWKSVSVKEVTTHRSGLLEDGFKGIGRVSYLNLTWREGLNKIKYLPGAIGKLAELNVLIISDNSLESLPKNVSYLRRLTMLDISGNVLDSLPFWIDKLANLQVLKASRNRICYIPYQIKKLDAIKTINLSHNALHGCIPKWISYMGSIKNLYVDSNSLTCLPASIVELSNLHIDIRHNSICNVSDKISNWLKTHQIGVEWRFSQKCENDNYYTSRAEDEISGATAVIRSKSDISNYEFVLRSNNLKLPLVDWKAWKAVEILVVNVQPGKLPYMQIDLTIPYGDIDLNKIDMSSIKLFYDENGKLTSVEKSVDEQNKKVSASVSRLGTYILAANMSTTVGQKEKSMAVKAGGNMPHTYIAYTDGGARVYVSIPGRSSISIRLFGANGQRICTVAEGMYESGNFVFDINAGFDTLSSKVCFAVICTDNLRLVRPIVLR